MFQIHKRLDSKAVSGKSAKFTEKGFSDRQVSGVVISEKQSLNSLPNDGRMFSINTDIERND